jgi:hypothetical protein
MANPPRPTLFGRAAAPKSTAGKTRTCPHCKTLILDSASICPACQGYLRFDSRVEPRAVPELSPLRVSATVRHPEAGEPWEYSVVLSVCNERGVEISRQVVGVGALQPMEQRTFNLAVEVYCPNAPRKS